jgi:outer membrane protein
MTNNLFTLAAASVIALAATPAAAQRGGTLVVDVDRILTDCTACKSAAGQLQSQATQLRTRAQQLETQLKPEAEALQTAINALNGKQPDAALQQRAQAFRTKQQQAETELGNRNRTLESTQAHVQQQIGQRLVVVAEQVRARRQGAAVIAKNSLLASDPAADVTGEVLTALNSALPSVSVTPLPQAQQQSAPQGR